MWSCILLVCLIGDVVGQEKSEADGEQASQSEAVEADEDKLFWIFLTTGKSSKDEKPESIEQMQAAHLANFKKLADEGKLLTAGPMKDPEEKLRGIVVVKAKDRAELSAFFKNDPYVQEGFLRIEATEMKFEHGVINTKITPQGLEEFRLIVYQPIGEKKMDTEQDAANQKGLAEMAKEKDLRLTVVLPKVEFNRAALVIMAKPEEDKVINERLQQLPAIKAGYWKATIYPLFMGKGSLADVGG